MADKCTPKQYLNATQDAFQTYMDNAIAGGWSVDATIKSMMVELVKEDSDIPAKAFYTFLRDSEEYQLIAPTISEFIKTGDNVSFLSNITETPILQDYIDPEDVNPVIDAQMILESLDSDEGKDTDIKTTSYESTDIIDTIFLKGIDLRFTKQQYAQIATDVRDLDFNSAMNYIKKILKTEDLINTPKKKQAWRKWWNSNLSINRRPTKSELYLSDLYKKKDGSFYVKKDKLRLQRKAVEGNNFINPRTGRREPNTEFVPFYDINRPYGKNGTATLKDSTTTMTIKDGILNAIKKKDGSIFHLQANHKISPSYLKAIDIQFMSLELGYKQTLVGAVPGDSGKLVFAKILGEHYSLLLPASEFRAKDEILKEMPEAVYNKLVENDYKALKTLNELKEDPDIDNDTLQDYYNVVQEIAEQQYINYFKQEFEDGNINQNHLDDFIGVTSSKLTKAGIEFRDEAEKVNRPEQSRLGKIGIFLEEIAKHQWYQAISSPDYLKMGSTLDILNRLKLMMAKGVVAVGRGKIKSVMIDPKNTDWYIDGKPVTHMHKIYGQLIYNGDGTIFSDTNFFELLKIAGMPDMRSVKTVGYVNNKDGFGVNKGLKTIAIPGLEIRKKENNELLIKTILSSDGKSVSIEGPGGKPINEFLTFDERKLHTGEFSKLNTIQTFDEETERILIEEGPSKSSTASPFQFLDLLGDPRKEHAKVREILEAHVLDVAKGWLNRLKVMSNNPNKLKAGIKRMLDYHENDFLTEMQKHYKHSKDYALAHPHILNAAIPMLTNQFLRDGLLQARVTNQKLYGGTLVKFKMGVGKYEPSSQNNILVSIKNNKIKDIVYNKMIKDSPDSEELYKYTEDDRGALRETTDEEKRQVLNLYIKNNDVWILTFRKPVDSLPAVSLKKLERFTGYWDSNAGYLHPEDVFGSKRGDHDGDTLGLEVLPDKITKPLIPLIGSNNIFTELPVELSHFEDKKGLNVDDNLSNRKSFYESMSHLIKGQGAQGLAYSMRKVRANLSLKRFKMRYKGKIISVIDPADIIVMNYIKVKDYINESNVKEYFKGIDEIALRGRNLMTTSEHELALIANAATDNPKKLKLTSMGYVGKGGKFHKPNDFFIEKIFKVREGNKTRRLNMKREEDFEIFQILRKVFKVFNTTKEKNGLTSQGKNASMKQIFEYSKNMYDKFNVDPEQFKINIAKEISSKNITIDPKDISVEPNMASDEKLISYIHEYSKDILNDKGISHIMEQNDVVINNSHNYAIRNLAEKMPVITNDAKKQAEGWMRVYGNKYFDEIQKGIAEQNEEAKYNPSMLKIDYNEEIVNWTNTSQAQINRMQPGARSWITYLYLQGVGNRKKVQHLPPMDLLDGSIMLEYKKLWHEKYYSKDKDLWVKEDEKRINKSYKSITGRNIKEDC